MARFVNNNTNELLTPNIQNTQTSPYAQSLVSEIIPPSRLGGGVIRGNLQSENYVSASTGWKLRRDGVIEALSIEIAGNSTIAGWNIDSTTIYQTGAVLSSTGYISFGDTPPTDYGNNVGAWLGIDSNKAKLSLYKDANNYFQWDGDKLLIKAANFTLDSSGNIIASNVEIIDSLNFSISGITKVVLDYSGLLVGAPGPNSRTFKLEDAIFLDFYDANGNFQGNSEIGWGKFGTVATDRGQYVSVSGVDTFEIDGQKCIISFPFTPASSSTTVNQGTITWDSSYLYIAVANNSWKRIALSSF